jgi:hypothetical protein
MPVTINFLQASSKKMLFAVLWSTKQLENKSKVNEIMPATCDALVASDFHPSIRLSKTNDV